MHLWRTLLVTGIFVSCACPAATIYRWTDAAGVVHYADHPGPGAHQVTVNVDVVKAVPTPVGGAPRAAPRVRHGGAAIPYTHFSIDSPTQEQSFFSQAVPVHLTMQPALQPGHRLTWSLNGKNLAADANQIGFTLPNLPRGAYTLTATVSDVATRQALKNAAVRFYVHRPSLLNRFHRPR
ncbi:MAG: DUF4124 domain-containing protein [Steroidobacteraceae bacterium]|nr:DUF4124 domain-containing protein [Steroidobacteraceae bacterium]